MEQKTLIESAKEYIQECPYLNILANIHINYLEDIPNSFSIEEAPKDDASIMNYLDGTIEKQFYFNLVCLFPYNITTETNIQNSKLLENLEEWVDESNIMGNLPILKEGYRAISMHTAKPGYLVKVLESNDKAKYQIHFKLVYEKENI